MKKLSYIYSLVLLLGLMSACTEDMDYTFNDIPEDRVEKNNILNKDVLASSEFGWITYYGPVEKYGAWPLVMKFTEEGYVNIKAYPFNTPHSSFPGNTAITSFKINTTQTTNLVFESLSIFTYWHNIKEPVIKADGTVAKYPNGDIQTTPLKGGEFQFVILSANKDKIILESLTDKGENKTILILNKAKKSDWDLDLSKLAEMKRVLTTGTTSTDYFRRIAVEGADFNGQFRVDTDTRLAYFDHLEDGNIVSSKHRLAITETGFELLDSLQVSENVKIASFNYKKENNTFEYNKEGLKAVLDYSNTPGLIFFPFAQDWGFPNGEKVDCSLDYSIWNPYKGVVSEEFYALCKSVSVTDGLRNIDFYMNNESNPSGSETTITLKYNRKVNPPFGFANINVDIPVTVTRVENEKVIFTLKNDYREAYKADIEYIEHIGSDSAEELIKVLTDKDGFYLIPDIYYANGKPYSVVMMICVAHPEYRFIAQYMDFSPIKK